MTNIIIYLLFGIGWAYWLEQFCMNNLDGFMAKPFTPRERLTQVLLWPVFVAIFIYNFIKGL